MPIRSEASATSTNGATGTDPRETTVDMKKAPDRPEHDHALKEVDAAALAVARTPAQVVEVLRYTLTGALPV